MAFKFFRVSVCDLDSGSDALNRFLQGHRAESVERRFVEDSQNSYWLFCVEYQERPQARASEPSTGPRRKERVDYRELLNDDDFQTYLGLKELRKQLADEEKVAIYLIFSNDQLAKIAESHVQTKEDLKKVEGIGEARADKYGDRVLEWLSKTRGQKHEASGKSVSEHPGVGKPAAGGDQGAAGKTRSA